MVIFYPPSVDLKVTMTCFEEASRGCCAISCASREGSSILSFHTIPQKTHRPEPSLRMHQRIKQPPSFEVEVAYRWIGSPDEIEEDEYIDGLDGAPLRCRRRRWPDRLVPDLCEVSALKWSLSSLWSKKGQSA